MALQRVLHGWRELCALASRMVEASMESLFSEHVHISLLWSYLSTLTIVQ